MLNPRRWGIFPLFLLLAVLFFFGAGCTQNANQWISKTARKAGLSSFTPLKLVYSLQNFGSAQDITATFWLEKKEVCNSRDAYLGLMKLTGETLGESGITAKFIVYADNGEVAMTKFVARESELIFGDFIPQYNDLPILLPLNSIFAFAGKNFITSEIWRSTAPLLLKQVDSGISLTDYAIVSDGEDASGQLPCQKFKIIAKGTDINGTLAGCFVKEIAGVKLPFVASFAFEDIKNGPQWQLKSYSKESSGIDWTLQCLPTVTCKRAEHLSDAEKSVCFSRGGNEEPVKDKYGCVESYRCQTLEEAADKVLAAQQREDCPVNVGLRAKIIQCRVNNKNNFEVVKYNNSGCATEIACQP
ncbi:MAG: hypothetical protein Q8M83_06505 [bacterium]|nr:hypothetical protein [bacterium]